MRFTPSKILAYSVCLAIFASGCSPTKPLYLNGGRDLSFYVDQATKIDYPDVNYLTLDEVNQEMVAAMIKVARTMQFRIVAEQVEHQEDFDWLRDIGVDFIQGHFVEPPAMLGARAAGTPRAPTS